MRRRSHRRRPTSVRCVRGDRSALDETGYERESIDEETVVQSFDVAGQPRDVEVTNVVTEYQKGIDAGPVGEHRSAVFVTFATPKVEIATRTFNPVGEMSPRELAGELQSQYDDVSIEEEVDVRELSILGNDVEVSTFEGEATVAGQGMDVYVHLGTAEADDDFVIVLGVYPRLVESQERENVVTLAEAVRHGG